ncbi:MAG: hypothetical protein ACJ731_03840 [Vicinamibacterales bacterium]
MTARAHLARALRAAIVLGVSLSYLSYVFDILHATFWHAGLGDWIDPYFINYLLEQWYHAVSTFSDPFSPPMFYPAQKTLGYSHGLLLYAPFYVPVRIFFHPFQAYSLTLFIVIETGIVSLYAIFRSFLRLSFVESLLLTVFFFTSPNVINGTVGVWSQRASVFVIPAIILLILISFRLRPGRPRLFLAGASGFLATLLLPHDFYTAHFAFFFAAVFLAAWILVEGHVSGRSFLRSLGGLSPAQKLTLGLTLIAAAWSAYLWTTGGVRTRILGVRIASQDWRRPVLLTLLCAAGYVWVRGASRLRADLKTAAIKSGAIAGPWTRAVVVGALAGCVVFLWIYLPAYREHPRFPEHDLVSQIRVRRWPGWLHALEGLSAYDTVRSFKLLALVAIVACVPRVRVDRKTRWYICWAVAVSALVFVMPARIGGFSIWLSFFRHVPGFHIIRDPTRVIFVYELAFILAAGLLLMRFRRRPVLRASICLLFGYFLLADYRVDTLAYERPRETFRRWVEAPIDIDPACRSFYIKRASEEYMSRSDNMWALYAGDAMFIALEHGLPTLNGYSAWGPEGWELTNPQEPSYADRVREWVRRNGLTNVCELDIEARTMRLAQ